MTKSIQFESNKLKNQKKKELVIIIFLSAITLSTLLYFSYIDNTPSLPSNIPKMYITCNQKINKHNYKDCVVDVDQDSTIAQIKFRGVAKWRYPKKEYRLQLSQRKSLLDMRRDDDWILFAMYIDYPHMRIKLSFDLWRSLKSTNPTAILPDSEFVNLYINGEYQGLYLLSEKFDRRLLDFDNAQDNVDSSLIFQAKAHPVFFNSISNYIEETWQQDWPNEDDDIFIKNKILPDLFSFITFSSDEEFFDPMNGIYSKFDKQNLIDFFIFNFFILHVDFWNTYYYIVRNTNPNKFFLIPWDFDGSFGQWATGLYPANTNHESEAQKNELYKRLLNNEEFKQDCKDRWFELRKTIWTHGIILDMLSDMYDEIKETLEISMDLWRPDLDYEEYVDCLFQWIPERLEYCDSYFIDL